MPLPAIEQLLAKPATLVHEPTSVSKLLAELDKKNYYTVSVIMKELRNADDFYNWLHTFLGLSKEGPLDFFKEVATMDIKDGKMAVALYNYDEFESREPQLARALLSELIKRKKSSKDKLIIIVQTDTKEYELKLPA